MNVAIVRYNAGNLQSVSFALNRLGIHPLVTADPEALRAADRVILPGVGEARAAMQSLHEEGLVTVLQNLEQPVLGICVGLQLFCKHSEERDTDCMNIVPGVQVRKFSTDGQKVPQIGWNKLTDTQGLLFKGISEPYVYFVNSFAADLSDYTVASCSYGRPFSAALAYRNFYAVQFHPEKSGALGQKILENFLEQDR